MDDFEVKNEIIQDVCEKIVKLIAPLEIYVIGTKIKVSSKLREFKLALIINDNDNPLIAEETIYRAVDCDIPFEVMIYNKSRFDRLSKDEYSFASKICDGGYKIYAKK